VSLSSLTHTHTATLEKREQLEKLVSEENSTTLSFLEKYIELQVSQGLNSSLNYLLQSLNTPPPPR